MIDTVSSTLLLPWPNKIMILSFLVMVKKLRNLLHLPDAVELIIKSIEKVDKLGKHEIFIAGGQHSIKVFDLATKLIKLINSNSKIILAEERTRVDWDPLIDISKANRILGFSPISVSEGLKQYALELS
jgi:nucleoside-diphosphate-sugar epimerase